MAELLLSMPTLDPGRVENRVVSGTGATIGGLSVVQLGPAAHAMFGDLAADAIFNGRPQDRRRRLRVQGRLPFGDAGGYGPAMGSIVERARAIAEDVFFPTAMDTDASDLLPATHLDLLAREGFYGISGPADAGGMDLDPPTTSTVVESLASGCLTTAFVWLQHRNPVRAVATSDTPGVREAWLAALCRGDRRAGIALAGNRPGPPILRATRAPRGDVILDGEAPWVSGWGRIHVILVTARDGDNVVKVLLDATETPTLRAERLHLVGANASGTVTLRFHEHAVPAERVVGEEPHADVLARDASGLRLNGSLALGVVDRCCRLIGPSAFDGRLVAVRKALDDATPERLPAARAAASELAMRAAAALTVAHGSRSILADQHPQRLAREAVFLLVFGSRPAIRAELSRRLADP